MGTQYRVSELMDNYTDNKFLVSERQGADTEAVLKGVMDKVKPKKRLRFSVRVLAAAAVAAAVSITAAVTATASKPVRTYTLADGSKFTYGGEVPCVVNGDGSSEDNIYVIENGRVYFTFDDQHLDITDLIDYDTPYCYRSDLTDSLGEVHEHWVAVGGTPKYIGWAEAIVDFDGNGFTYMSGRGDVWYEQYYIDGEVFTDLGKDYSYNYTDLYPYRSPNFGWYEKFDEKFYPHSQEHYDAELEWHYPRDWEGESVDDNIPLPENLYEFE